MNTNTQYHSFTNYRIHYTFIIHYFDITIMRNQRRVGEALMIASGIGVAVGGFFLGIMFLAYGGLAIAGLGIFSVFWR
jgi:hypothetical protein